MDQNQVKDLLSRYRTNTCTPAEKKLVEMWLQNLYESSDQEIEEEVLLAIGQRIWDKLPLSSLENKILHSERPVPRVHYLRKWGWAAASILLIVSLGAYLFFNKKSGSDPASSITSSSEILPGKDGAILTLADGSQVSLDSIQNGIVALQGGATARVVNGILQYEGSGNEVVYNTMSTPKGRQFHLTLPDGTAVWLNSASSIRYPTVFNGNERRVEVSGEAYFEVAKNKKIPFRLSVNNKAEVEVLGTQFNVNAYENEKTINTTLIEGSVKVSSKYDASVVSSHPPKYPENVTLKPGQQAQLLLAGQKTQPGMNIINSADIEKVMAWKNGFFDFNSVDFDAAMRQLERWYDIEVVYEKSIPKNIDLYGRMTKDVKLNDLLIILSKIGVKCRLDSRKLIIEG